MLDDSSKDQAFSVLYRAHYDFVWRNALRLGVEPPMVDDVLQETFVVVLEQLDDFEGRAQVSTWLFAILRNVSRNHHRGRLRHERKVLAFAQSSESIGALQPPGAQLAAEGVLAGRLLYDFLMDLDERQREVYVLAELEGMSRREISIALEININTVQSRLRVARAEFDRCFSNDRKVPQLCAILRQHPPRAPAQQRERTRALVLAGGVPPKAAAVGSAANLSLLGSKVLPLFLVANTVTAGLALATVVDLEQQQSSGPALDTAASPVPNSELPSAPLRAAPAPKFEPAHALASEHAVTAPAFDEALVVTGLAPPRKRPRLPAPTSVELGAGDEYGRFGAARKALVAGRLHEALSLTRELDPKGELGWERAVTEVAALCGLGRAQEARAIVSQWNQLGGRRTIDLPCE